jgi:fucose 4-O-acetylase-like acetyltransferase
MNSDTRVPWVDALKGLGIVLVVLGHQSLPPTLKHWLYSFHVPLFFFVSGLLFNPEKYATYRAFAARRWRTVLVPYFVFSLATYLVWLVAMRPFGAAVQTDIAWWRPIVGTLVGLGQNDWLAHNVPLWFLPCLFVTDQLFWFIHRNTRLKMNLGRWLIGFAVLGWLIQWASCCRWPWSADVAFTAVVFYGLGYVTRRDWHPRLDPSFVQRVGLPLVLVAGSLLFSLWNKPVDLNRAAFGHVLLFYPAALAGIALALLVARRLSGWSSLRFVGRHTLVVLALHNLAATLVTKVLVVLLPGVTFAAFRSSLFWSLLVTAAAVALLAPVAVFIDRRLPWLLGRTQRV